LPYKRAEATVTVIVREPGAPPPEKPPEKPRVPVEVIGGITILGATLFLTMTRTGQRLLSGLKKGLHKLLTRR